MKDIICSECGFKFLRNPDGSEPSFGTEFNRINSERGFAVTGIDDALGWGMLNYCPQCGKKLETGKDVIECHIEKIL